MGRCRLQRTKLQLVALAAAEHMLLLRRAGPVCAQRTAGAGWCSFDRFPGFIAGERVHSPKECAALAGWLAIGSALSPGIQGM